MAMVAVRVDEKGRVSIPRTIRRRLGINPGDVLFVNEEGEFVRYAKAANPFDALAAHAVQEYREGRTVSLAEVAQGWSLDLDQLRAKAMSEGSPSTVPDSSDRRA